jgi:hypothetical protein
MALLTSKTLPVMSPAASDSRNATRPATSAASPKRRSVIVSARVARFLSGKIAVMSWLSGPGAIATRRSSWSNTSPCSHT